MKDDVETQIDTVAQRVLEAAPESKSFTLKVLEGPDTGLAFTIDGSQPSRVFVGQGPACQLRLDDPLVSRRHAALQIIGGRLRLNDLGSTNGTFVNGLFVTDVGFVGGETVRFGSTVISVVASSESSPIPVSPQSSFGRVLGASVEMRRLYPLCERVAGSDVSVIIEGETGTGKEVLAEAIHAAGARAAGPFMIFDCTAVPPSLVESELFGHERGAFTGAVSLRRGIFEQAHGGTLFVDEIGDLDGALQPKLLRALQRGEIRRVGGDKWIPVDVRIIAATRRDLDREVAAGRFRDDLFFRLAVVRIELPPLRERRGDISLLAEAFWRELRGPPGGLSAEVLQRFEEYAWPGNVRELYNAVSRLIAVGDAAPLHASQGDAAQGRIDAIDEVLGMNLPLPRARERVIEEFERRYVERIVQQHGGNVSRAAAASGIGHRYFQKIRARLAK